ncbi:SRPBCC family protein [Robiginitalea sp. M366]|uniref:SRPBCC family protein n=1 Tax=Robiginitalea aestuariiviva TaxID=3036903 RepID=UPI00240E18EF|nr:SRPBCC family protein [Robiginitalea aestuariiviva]MDG1570741.1 SRPBCC family protein [Robiginitalea aestuariiviva]
MHLEAPTARIEKSRKEVYAFLSDLKNFEQLMPENIQTFEVLDEDTFRFALKGMPEIVLKRKTQQPESQIVLGAASDKLPFSLTADIQEAGPQASEVRLSFAGDFNPMMAMMIKGPITNFIGTLSQKLSQV